MDHFGDVIARAVAKGTLMVLATTPMSHDVERVHDSLIVVKAWDPGELRWRSYELRISEVNG